MIELVRRVIAGEGLASAMRRARVRATEALHERLLLLRGRLTRSRASFPILNLLATPATPRLGGIQIHLLSRLREERALRPVALLAAGTLTLSRPHEHAHRITKRYAANALDDDAFVQAVHEAIAITGARTLHIEGMYGVPTRSVLRLIDEGVDVVLSLHDFALLADDPHHFTDLDTSRRRVGTELLHRACAVIYPSRFLERVHGRPGTIISAAIPPAGRITQSAREPRRSGKPRIAFAGSVQTRKGAQLMQPIVHALRGRDIDWFVFGGGDAAVLATLRALPNVAVHGQYAMGALPELLARNDIDLVLLVSRQPETYSLTLSESWLAGVPVIAFAHGAIEERVQEHGGGWLVPLSRGAEGIVAAIERWIEGDALPPVPTNIETAHDAARRMIELYDSLACR